MKIGLALSGGGAKGAAHIGVIKAFEENGIKISMIGGTSSGSIVAALYAMGYDTKQILDLFEYFSKSIVEADPKYFIEKVKINKKISIEGIRSGENIEKAVMAAAEYKNLKWIKDLKMPIVIPAVDINKGKKYVFTNYEDLKEETYIHEAEIGKATRASSSFPALFAPFYYLGHQFLDGGILDNIPADEVKNMGADIVISIRFPNKEERGKNVYSILLRTWDVMFNRIAEESLKSSDYILDIDTGKTKVMSINKLKDCYDTGYITAISKMKEIKQICREA